MKFQNQILIKTGSFMQVSSVHQVLQLRQKPFSGKSRYFSTIYNFIILSASSFLFLPFARELRL